MGLFSFLLSLSVPALASLPQTLQQQAEEQKWEHDPHWHRLLQYKKLFWGGYESAAEPGPFFLASEGRTNPTAELHATLEALWDVDKKITSVDGRYTEPAACFFPARRKWLEQKAGVKFPPVTCERWERFQEILAPQSLTYVFSSYYLNNPASAFGHTFLRINKAPSARDGERYELSDYGVGYAAIKVSDNPFVYSFLGLSGLMPGSFEINPYYYKVREYNDFESRDLWEYDLNFTPDEVDMAVAYIWELQGAKINYRYMSENCAYRILTIFEVARPGLELIPFLKTQVMPADTVTTLYRSPGLVTKIHYRPSVRALFQSRYAQLSPQSQDRLVAFSRDSQVSTLQKDLTQDHQREALDAAMDYLDYRYPKEILTKTGHYTLKKEVLAARAELGGRSQVLKIPEPWSEAPHDAQGSRRWSLGAREWNNEKFYVLDMKLALHDLLDPKLGYPPTAEITMGSFGISYRPETHEVALDRALIYEVISLAPMNQFNMSPSWRLKVSLERGYENGCTGLCRWTELSGGSAFTTTFWHDLDLSAWVRVTGQTSPDFYGDTWRLGAGPSLSLRWNRGALALLAETYYRYDYRGDKSEFRQTTAGLNLSFNKSLSLRVLGEDSEGIQRLDGRILWYY